MLRLKPFRDWSIRRKLTGLFMAMACITAVTVSVSIGAFDLLGLERSMVRDLSILADVLGQNSAAALTFQDADTASHVLEALKAEPNVTTACVYTANGKPFATYVRPGRHSGFVPPHVHGQSTSFEADHLILFRTIVFSGDTIGTIYIESDLQPLHTRLREYGLAILAAALLTLLLALLIAPSLQRPISQPLIQLTQTAEAISKAADYAIRAHVQNSDEFGMLGSAFNDMLDQIETRNHQLHQHREHLEEEVTSRTAELLAASARLELQAEALNAASNSILITDRNGNIVWSNPAFSKSSGYSAVEAMGKDQSWFSSGEQDIETFAQMWSTITAGGTWHGEIVNRRKNDGLYIEEVTVTPVSSQSGEITNFVAIKHDITARKLAEQALSEAEEKYRAIFEDAVVGIFQVDPGGRPISINRALAQMHGYDTAEEFLAEITDIWRQVFVEPNRMFSVVRETQENGIVQGAEVEVYRKDRAKRWVIANIRAARDSDGNILLYEGTAEDITERKVAEERVQFLAYYDALTGLPNRTLLEDRIAIALGGARRRKERIACLFLDLDRFKIVNDTLGHSVGDTLLQEVAERLKKWVREQDTVARVGGDEFVIMLTGLQLASDAAAAAERVVDLVTSEFSIHGHSLNVTCSVGISMFPENGMDGETLVKNADAAMYSAKQKGPNNVEFFTEDLNVQMVERLKLESGLRLALERKEFYLVYQPQMDIATEKIVGVEALLRWQNPELGLVPPDRFISIAENSGLIVPIGEWVLRTACAQARKWQDEGLAAVPVAVNVSAVQFRQDGFRDLIKNVLRETGLAPQYLELELTESLLLTNADVMFSVLRELNEMGLMLAIDDFGTGYSSLSYLRQFPVKKLKIDRSFIRNVALNPSDAAITTAIIGMAKSLGLKVIAEGVENEAQMSFLREHRCDEIQGYYFSRPITASEVAGRLLSVQAIGYLQSTQVSLHDNLLVS
jgi:diguanylate cyclase (GGDEF)-like protein/PAS domain S-box-containing protein